MTAAVEEVLTKLIALHGMDLKIRRLEQDLDRAPAQMADRERAIGAIDAKIKALDDKLQVLKAQIRLRENEVKTHEAKIGRLKTQSSEVRTNKEFVAFRSEIANTQGDADRLQNEVIKILDVVEQAEAKVTELKAKRDEEVGRADELKRQAGERMVERRKDLEALRAARPQQLDGLDKEALDHYDRVREAHGSGLAVMEGQYCSGCGSNLTRNDVYAVQNRTRLVACKDCNRYLYLP